MVIAVHGLNKVDHTGAMLDAVMYLVSTIAVPLFCVADGYVFSWKFTGVVFDYVSFVKKSAMRLLLPWAAFTVVYGVVRIGLEGMDLTRETILIGSDFTGILKVLYLSGLSTHMYFLLSLFLIRLCTIGMSGALRWSGWHWAVLTLVYMVVYRWIEPKRWFLPGADPILLALWGGQFYLLGIVIQKWIRLIRLHAVPLFVVCVGMAVGAWVWPVTHVGWLGQIAYLTAACIALLLITDHTTWSFALGRDSMGVYLLHAPFIIWGTSLAVTTVLSSSPLIAFTLITFASVVVSWLAARWLSLTAGGRFMLGQIAGYNTAHNREEGSPCR
jgi:fucose 4-O-acetylase-like acetyltransferase